MKKNDLSNIDFTYHVFSPKAWLEKSQPQEVQLAFETWLKVWTDTYKGRDFEVKAEEFIRHDMICAVMAGDEAAAVHCYSFFELSSKPDVSTKYFQFFSPTFVEKMKQRNIHTVMSMEYLTVNEKFRSSVIGFSLGRVLIQLGVRLFEDTPGHAIVAPARKDVKVHEMAYDCGFTCIEEDVIQRGFSCDMIAYFKGSHKNVTDPFLSRICDRLWENRVISDSVRENVLLKVSAVKKAL
ncbi:MAG: hypothetical protein V4654_02510 [Bdellovibrionota bacterium]